MKLLGIEINLDLSWLVLFILLVWSLSQGVFPIGYPDLPARQYWWMGIVAALGLFASLILHELCHAVVARRYGIPVRGITLFVFGGVAEMEEEPPSAKAEFLMAIVGPLLSVVLGFALGGAAALARHGHVALPVVGVLGYLAWINFIVAGFNMLPAFPLDGGRVLRAALWGIKKDVRWATRIAAGLGGGLGLLLAVFGLYRVFRWDFIGGLWFFLIGMFLRQAAQASYERLLIRKLFAGETVRSFMRQNPISVSPLLSVQELVEDYFYRYHFKLFPVVSDGRLVGCVHLESLRELPKSSWAEARVEQLAGPCSPQNTIAPDTDLIAALSLLNRTQSSMLMVVERQRLVGIITLKDIMNFLAIKMALQEIEAPPHKTGGTSVGDVSRIHGSPDRVLAGTQA